LLVARAIGASRWCPSRSEVYRCDAFYIVASVWARSALIDEVILDQLFCGGGPSPNWRGWLATIELKIPMATRGSYFPSLLEPPRRAERALHAVVV